jgi:hypothetical protein
MANLSQRFYLVLSQRFYLVLSQRFAILRHNTRFLFFDNDIF